MAVTHLPHATPDVPPHQRESVEAAKLVRKLRWIGKEDEARVLERQLRDTPRDERASVLSEPFSTD
jgi:hypothetical protein